MQEIYLECEPMNKPLPQSAFFLPPPSSENSGVDFLGLRQANLDMMADLIPGTNNVTPYIRPFSILSWIYWKFHDLCVSVGQGALSLLAKKPVCSGSALKSSSSHGGPSWRTRREFLANKLGRRWIAGEAWN